MAPHAKEVAKMQTVTPDKLDRMLPDYVSGGDIRAMFKEELDEAKQVLAHGGKGKYKVVNDGSGSIDVMFKGKSVGRGDYDRGAGSFFMSIKGEKGQKSFDDAQAIADYFAKNKITEEVELDENFLPLFFALWGTGAMVVLPALIIYDIVNRESNYKLDAKVGEIVGKLISKFKKDKNYKPNSAEIDASK